MGRFTLQVLFSNHGYYLGTETDELMPYSRESGYWAPTDEGFQAAEKALQDLLDGKGLPLDKRYDHPANLGLVEKIMKGLAEKKERKKQQDDTPDDINEYIAKLF